MKVKYQILVAIFITTNIVACTNSNLPIVQRDFSTQSLGSLGMLKPAKPDRGFIPKGATDRGFIPKGKPDKGITSIDVTTPHPVVNYNPVQSGVLPESSNISCSETDVLSSENCRGKRPETTNKTEDAPHKQSEEENTSATKALKKKDKISESINTSSDNSDDCSIDYFSGYLTDFSRRCDKEINQTQNTSTSEESNDEYAIYNPYSGEFLTDKQLNQTSNTSTSEESNDGYATYNPYDSYPEYSSSKGSRFSSSGTPTFPSLPSSGGSRFSNSKDSSFDNGIFPKTTFSSSGNSSFGGITVTPSESRAGVTSFDGSHE